MGDRTWCEQSVASRLFDFLKLYIVNRVLGSVHTPWRRTPDLTMKSRIVRRHDNVHLYRPMFEHRVKQILRRSTFTCNIRRTSDGHVIKNSTRQDTDFEPYVFDGWERVPENLYGSRRSSGLVVICIDMTTSMEPLRDVLARELESAIAMSRMMDPISCVDVAIVHYFDLDCSWRTPMVCPFSLDIPLDTLCKWIDDVDVNGGGEIGAECFDLAERFVLTKLIPKYKLMLEEKSKDVPILMLNFTSDDRRVYKSGMYGKLVRRVSASNENLANNAEELYQLAGRSSDSNEVVSEKFINKTWGRHWTKQDTLEHMKKHNVKQRNFIAVNTPHKYDDFAGYQYMAADTQRRIETFFTKDFSDTGKIVCAFMDYFTPLSQQNSGSFLLSNSMETINHFDIDSYCKLKEKLQVLKTDRQGDDTAHDITEAQFENLSNRFLSIPGLAQFDEKNLTVSEDYVFLQSASDNHSLSDGQTISGDLRLEKSESCDFADIILEKLSIACDSVTTELDKLSGLTQNDCCETCRNESQGSDRQALVRYFIKCVFKRILDDKTAIPVSEYIHPRLAEITKWTIANRLSNCESVQIIRAFIQKCKDKLPVVYESIRFDV